MTDPAPDYRGLAPGQVDIWRAHLSCLTAEAMPGFHALLSSGEATRLQGFKVRAARDRFLLGRILLRSVLSNYAAVQPQDWTVAIDRYGRPFVQQALRPGLLTFNLSHSADVAVLAVTVEHSVGIDVEKIAPRIGMAGIARLVFCPAEIEHWASHATEAGRADAFFRIWTLKEAFVKALGLGFSFPLQSFAFEIDRDPPEIVFSPGSGTNQSGQAWAFWQRSIPGDYVLALAAPAQKAPLCVSLHSWPPAAQSSDGGHFS